MLFQVCGPQVDTVIYCRRLKCPTFLIIKVLVRTHQVEAELLELFCVGLAAVRLEPLGDDEDSLARLVAEILAGEEDAAAERVTENQGRGFESWRRKGEIFHREKFSFRETYFY